MKNKIISITIALMLSLPVFVQAEDNFAVSDVPQAAEEQVTESLEGERTTVQSLDEDAQVSEDETTLDKTFDFKQPISKRKLLKKLLLAMFGVAVSSLLLYIVLSAYNRFRDGYTGRTKTPEGNVSLDLPDNLNSAVKTFLEKTNWD